LPDEIAKVAQEINGVDNDIEDQVELFKIREHELLNLVSSEMDPATNKLKYTNAEMRQGETLKRTKTDPQAIAISTKLRDLRDTRDTLRVKGDLLANTFSAVKHRADLYSSWMRQAAGL
jgi:hypothetical protein